MKIKKAFILAYMQAKNLTQSDFCRRAGISRRCLQNLLAGGNASPKTRRKIQLELDCKSTEIWEEK